MLPAPMLEHFVQLAQPWLEHYGYAAVFMALFLESIGIPTLGLTLFIASLLLASRGEMQIGVVIGLALAGMLGGCQLAFLFGRTGGRRLLLRSGLLNRHHLRRLHRLFLRWGPLLLLAAPFLDGTRQYGALVAGTAQMRWRTFTLYNLAGVVLWIGSWSIATDLLGHHLEPVLGYVHRSGPWIFGGIGALLVVMILYRLLGKFHVPPSRDGTK
jgi:membrane protein DedA with SNARE-associated domain